MGFKVILAEKHITYLKTIQTDKHISSYEDGCSENLIILRIDTHG